MDKIRVNIEKKQAFNRLLKSLSFHEDLKRVLPNNDGKYSLTNSYYIVTYTNIEQVPEELKGFIRGSVNEFSFENYKYKDTKDIDIISFNIEALKKIYKWNKEHKSELNNTNLFSCNNNYTFNLQYFFDILALLDCKDLKGVEKIEIPRDEIKNPMSIYTKNGNALLLPVYSDRTSYNNTLKERQDKIIKGLI